MKPRTAAELDYWMGVGLSPEEGEQYMQQYPEEHAKFGFAYAGVRMHPERYRNAASTLQCWESFGGRDGCTDSAYFNPNAVYERAKRAGHGDGE